MSQVIVDGYNLIGTQHRDLRKEREELIKQLIAYKKRKGHDITVIFDGWKTGGHREEHSTAGGVHIVYSRLGERADEVIGKMIRPDGKERIVITSDREVADHAWSQGAVPVPSGQFMERLERVDRNPENTDGDTGGEEDNMRGRGNPRQHSKKEKALIRALRKL